MTGSFDFDKASAEMAKTILASLKGNTPSNIWGAIIDAKCKHYLGEVYHLGHKQAEKELRESRAVIGKADRLLIYMLDQHSDILHQVIYEDVYKFVKDARARAHLEKYPQNKEQE